jgi:circadian clock protein KaiC
LGAFRSIDNRGGEPIDSPLADPGALQKAPTGIRGFDEITRGGLPRGRVTLLVGGPGAGKTLLALEMLVRGAREFAEPAVFVAFEENSRQIITNATSFGWDLPALERERLFFLDARLSPHVVRSGDFDLSAMLAGIGAKIDEMGAKRIVFDGIDVLLTLLDDPAAERREVYRIHHWLQDRELTAVLTAKAAESDRPTAERYAFMQFMVDSVVLLQHRLLDRVSLRSIRVVKYRGSGFGENEYPLVITPGGIEISTFGGAELVHKALEERISSGIPRLDAMIGGGYHRGSSVLITGAPGTAKTTLGGSFVARTSADGERALYVSFDEAAPQIVRNLRSVGIDLGQYVDAGLLHMYSVRTEVRGSEEHLIELRKMIEAVKPSVIVLDPISALAKTGGLVAATHASLRLLDVTKAQGITALCTSLTANTNPEAEATLTQISTIADSWIHLAYVARGGERNRTLTVVKSRGTKHSNQVRELVLSDDGIKLADVYAAGGEVLVGTARWEREAEVREAERRRRAEADARRMELELVEAEIQAQITALQSRLTAKRLELDAMIAQEERRRVGRSTREAEILRLRDADADTRAVVSDGTTDERS